MEFIKGFDISSLLEVERCGGIFRDGGEQLDALEILKRYGANWTRLRLWNAPYDEANSDYGAGVCDLAAVQVLAHRAKDAGMKWLLDFHYSDFWADPGKQTVPKEWRGLDESALEQAVYQYTKNVLCACRTAARHGTGRERSDQRPAVAYGKDTQLGGDLPLYFSRSESSTGGSTRGACHGPSGQRRQSCPVPGMVRSLFPIW